MNTRIFFASLLVSLALGVTVSGEAPSKEQLGKVDFPNSCAPAVQEPFQRAVAMLHSFRYTETEKAFREVLAQDPSCAIATWGIAAILMSNPLAGVGPSPPWAERAQAAIDQGRQIGAKTQRERDYIEAVAAYYEDWANRPERTRQLDRAVPSRRWPRAIRTTTRHRFSPPFTLPPRSRWPIKPTRPISEWRRSWRSSSQSILTTQGSPTI
jgi:hypothetical protein